VAENKEETVDITPQYNLVEIDKKISEMEKFLFRSDSKIKTANATLRVELDVDVDSLLAPIV
jgi:hypothetical protein